MQESFYYTSQLFKSSFYAYLLVFGVYLLGLFVKKKWAGQVSLACFGIAFLICTALVADRWIEAGRPPFKSLYESLIFAVWTVSLISLVAEWRFKIRLVGVLSSFSILAIFLYSLTKRDVEIIALPPALQTWMFIPHVISYFVAYGALFVAGLGAVLYLILPKGMASHHSLGLQSRIDFSDFTYQITKLGFLFLTLGLLLGAWWGQSAWSNYWAWDPKENWALITWLVFAAYLHFRNIASMDKRKLSWVVIIGVLAVIFTYLGMGYLPTANDSLHVYSNN
ncbi:MAG: cytochrome c biogenesis protein CcsA [Saprospiraceae bacterium]|nr:cytochrome c biogenesis protein CcsA [Saprospiraceae bacterium]MCF8251962.1 cytochrome c biogenesis protein CcsA [Saprospiraceae bacterium]MCF8282771.1 cytochrome c biogenesis protein CcsA [Bacteroidales bacterium]MCF8313634.1 cytochrome c biogenesis protein CcsA [Saprospiraceae bacterium]MCF8442341.1 cytochrome c biogenesis protein CcsA [Saprospiraceae bacterium]